jgi:hypothetical protein
MARRKLLGRGLVILALAGVIFVGASVQVAAAGDGPLKGAASLADHGTRALEQLPWDAHVIRANLGKRTPVSIAGCYLMDRDLIVISEAGRIYCLARRNLEPRWVNTLRHPLARAPVESATHYAFLMKDYSGAYWVQVISKRSGAVGDRFPVRLPYAASSGIAVNQNMVFVGSLGSPRNNKTLETISVITAKRGWGYRGSGLLWGDPQLDPDGTTLVLAADDGVVTALPAGASAPKSEHWSRDIGIGIRGSTAVTPEHIVVGTDDGLLYNLNLLSGKVNWLVGLDERIRSTPWVFGSYKIVKKSTGVEGAAPVEVKSYIGTAFARNINGLHAVDLVTGEKIFSDKNGGRPLCQQGKYLLTIDGRRKITMRDTTAGHKVTGTLNLGVFDLIPTNDTTGEIYACTSDGWVVASIPK